MMRPEKKSLEFAIQILQKTLVSKENGIQEIKFSNDTHIKTLFEEIDDRDEEIDQLKNEINAWKSMQDNNKTHIENLKHKHAREIYQLNVESRRITEKLQDRENELRSVNLQVQYLQEMSKQQSNCVAEL